MQKAPKTLFEKIWERHVVVPETKDTPAILYIDLHLIHEVTTPQAFTLLREKDLKVRSPDKVLATMDHSTPTVPISSLKDLEIFSEQGPAQQIRDMVQNCKDFGIELYGFESERRGIVHVIGPELGATQPGKTIVCGDSHTSTHGAFGALAFGIGTTEVAHVLATQCLLQRKPSTLAVNLSGSLNKGVSAKDIILKIIGQIGVDGGTGHVIEYKGNTVENLSLEQRMTICNMSIEAGARAGLFAPDNTTFDYLYDRPMSPKGDEWDRSVEIWKELHTDSTATFDKEVDIDVSTLTPMITYGTNPGMVIPIESEIPNHEGNQSFKKALEYMQFESGKPLLNHPLLYRD